MGGDKYVAAVAGEDVERKLGDELRERWERRFDELLPEVEPFDGAYEVIAALRERGHRIVLASSAIQSHFDAFVDGKLGARELADDLDDQGRRRVVEAGSRAVLSPGGPGSRGSRAARR